MSQVRAEAAGGDGSLDGVAVDARVLHEDGLAFSGGGVAGELLLGRLLLLLDPNRKLLRRLRVDAKEHLRVLGAAILSTLAEIEACRLWIDPHNVDSIWKQVSLARKTWYPEAVGHIGGR